MGKKNGMMTSKKSQFLPRTPGKIILSIVLLIIIIICLLSIPLSVCKYNGLGAISNSYANQTYNEHQAGIKGFYYKSLYKTENLLGFNTLPEYIQKYGPCWGFLIHKFSWLLNFLIGIIAGFWVWMGAVVPRFIAKGIRTGAGTRGRWLSLVSGSLWKIIAIGLGYAIILEIPVINRIVQLVSFELLGVNWFVRTFIIAFEIGYGPAWIESFMRYRLRMKYEKKVQEAVAGERILRATARA